MFCKGLFRSAEGKDAVRNRRGELLLISAVAEQRRFLRIRDKPAFDDNGGNIDVVQQVDAAFGLLVFPVFSGWSCSTTDWRIASASAALRVLFGE